MNLIKYLLSINYKRILDLLNRIRERLLRAIIKPEQTSVLDNAIKEAYNFYKNNLV